MTKNKRFTSNIHRIYDNNEEIACADTIDDAETLVELLNEQDERIKELLQDNDHKFWKHQFMHQFNSTSLIMHEISLAIEQGYEVSDKFKEYLDELKKKHEKRMKKANEQEKW